MMKWLFLIVAAFAVIASVNCYIDTDENQVWNRQLDFENLKLQLRKQALTEKFRTRIEAVCPGYGSRAENVTSEIQECATLIEFEDQTLCSIAQNDIPRCTKSVTNLLEECLPSQSKSVPSMFLQIYKGIIKHLCRTDGEHIFELQNECFLNVNPKTNRCLRTILAKGQVFARRNKYPTPGEICEIIEGLGPCLQSHLNAACGHHITKEAFLGVYGEVISVCKSYQENEIEVLNPTAE